MHLQVVTFQFTGVRASQAHGAALALGDRRGDAVAHVLAHHLLTKHRPLLTNTHSARLRVPDAVVGDDLPVGHAGILVRQNTVRSRWSSLSAPSMGRRGARTGVSHGGRTLRTLKSGPPLKQKDLPGLCQLLGFSLIILNRSTFSFCLVCLLLVHTFIL